MFRLPWGREGKGREGKERKGKERKGKERKGKERKEELNMQPSMKKRREKLFCGSCFEQQN